jgi:orotidine-5'-phosphate decarboxylase
MDRSSLIAQIRQKRSFLCVGLDTDPDKLPDHLRQAPDAVLTFNKAIIDATAAYCVAYKINTAFYEAMGPDGWEIMQQTVAYIPKDQLIIADAKRGDIGNTSTQYARAFFDQLQFDAITVAPYMGEDSVRPFLQYADKWTIVLALTSNKGASDFELQPCGDELLYEKVLRRVSDWGNTGNLMFVTGATQANALQNIRRIVPDHFLLVPGVGFQGGSLREVAEYGLTADCGLLVNVSRAIIFASDKPDFATEAGIIAHQYQEEMETYLTRFTGLLH